jgi:hypothetical protein
VLFCGFNLSNKPLRLKMPEGAWRLDLFAPFAAPNLEAGYMTLEPWQAAFAAPEPKE